MKKLDDLLYQSELLNIEINFTTDKMSQEKDEVNIIIWNDYLRELNYHLDGINCDIYLLRQNKKKSENENNIQK